MLSCKAFISEKDIENYTRSLILPSYMAYLTMDPFHFADQNYNSNGRESLIVSYSGEGRLEEVVLDPPTHAPAILRESHFGIDLAKILLPKDSFWNWSINTDQQDTERIMNLFFQPKEPFLGYESKQIFAPRDSYISVSRQELFLSNKIIREYLMERLRAFLLLDSPYMLLLDNDTGEVEEKPKVSWSSKYKDSDELKEEDADDSSRLSFQTTSDGFRLSIAKLQISFSIDSPEIFKDLLVFAHLDRAYKIIEEYIHFDWSNTQPRSVEEGFFLYPKERGDDPPDKDFISI